MNTKNLKAYAPKARAQFIEAIAKRAAQFGIYEGKISDIQFEGGSALIEGRAFTKKQGEQRKCLEKKIQEKPLATHKERYNLFIREMAYTWFNRLAAIRYMELHDYFDHGFRVLSHPNSQDQLPEILDNASDVADTLNLDKSHIIELQLAGDKEEELYRELLLGQCHYLAKVMPQIFKGLAFEQLDDATELLLPDNLTKTDSILKGLVNEIPEEDWSEIEVIGWLYQFYISEHKDSVIGKVVKSEDIPAATQLFTPNWIVKYLVQNSLGRQWLATYPESDLKGKMEYYIEPAEQSDDVITQLKAMTPTSIDPEQIKVLDPAAGSGHILVEVYEVLREIYLERGYRLREIPELILTKNIYGLDIDDRAAQLAGFALMMKAREDDRRIFQRVEDGEVSLNVYSLQSTEGLDIDKLWQALNLEGKQQQGSTGGLFDEPTAVIPAKAGIYKEYFELLQTLKSAFLQAKTLGSLIQINNNQNLQNLVALKELLQAKEKGSDPSAKQAASELLPIVKQAIILAQQYDVVVANPPYMGSKGMNTELKDFAKIQFPNSKTELFTMFIENSVNLCKKNGHIANIVLPSWLSISSFSKFRENLLSNYSIDSLLHMGRGIFGIDWGSTAFVMQKNNCDEKVGNFYRLHERNFQHIYFEDIAKIFLLSKENKEFKFDFSGYRDESGIREIQNSSSSNGKLIFYTSSNRNFKKISGSPIAYWLPQSAINLFENKKIGNIADTRLGMATADNNKFLRFWFEVDITKCNFTSSSRQDALDSSAKWFQYQKGGVFKKWFGNLEYVVNWESDGFEIQNFKDSKTNKVRSHNYNLDYIFKPGITWNALSSTKTSARVSSNSLFDNAGSSLFLEDETDLFPMLAYLNSNVIVELIKAISPTLNYQPGDIAKLPAKFSPQLKSALIQNVKELVRLSKEDWESSEMAYNFRSDNLTSVHGNLSQLVAKKINNNESVTELVKKLENENNILFANEFDLGGFIETNISLAEISLSCNHVYNSQVNTGTTSPICDQVNNIISYTIGCMMGRYSLDQEGLVYAHAGNIGFKELVEEGAYKTFPADDDGIVPLASEDWLFEDDATARFREFVKTVWSDEHLQENLEFVSESLCLHVLKPKKGESAMDTIRRYFSTQFFKDHYKTYKKRPIYWLFSSGKEKAFECLVYLHRYNEGTLARMRTEYVTPLMGKYEQQQSLLTEQIVEASTTEKRRIEKELKLLEKKQAELRTFDEQLKHYAEKRITLDLDDGVKVNYGKFGTLLADVKAIHGKAVK